MTTVSSRRFSSPGNGPRVTAMLGPTNTGKTHFAIERMLAHRSGMIGFPLRLLARENYDRVVREKGRGAAALITGEERIVPANPCYFLCTVEAMPRDRRVAFLAIDEVQLAADPERGHVFTDRILYARGSEETLLLGAATVRRLLKRLVPDVEIVSRPRLSRLGHSGVAKITRMPPRSAVVAFSAADVYGLAELMRRRRGGAAVVMGGLSPRTRNAQVAMYQAGEVDYLVATDAIGMGLNMDVRHVAFSSLVKFDGRAPRLLSPAEIAQIAGRAGRHVRDGTFGTTGTLGPLAPELVEAVESHVFEPLRVLYWRNIDLDFATPAALLRSLEIGPPERFLRRPRPGQDHQALATLAAQEDILRIAGGRDAVALLWEVCRIPDFRKTLSDDHARLVGRTYRYLMTAGRLPEDWVRRSVDRLDRVDGDIETLVGRIAHVRTWAYVSHRDDWLDDSGHWRERSRAIEDRLSDALHERLTQRFVDRRAATLVRRMRDAAPLYAAVTRTGEVVIEGEYVGRLEGFRFRLDQEAGRDEARALSSAALRALRGDVTARVARFEAEGDDAFALDRRGRIAWRGAPVARLRPGAHRLKPAVEPLPSDLLEPVHRDRVRRRLARWLEAHIARILAPLMRIRDGDRCDVGEGGAVRGLCFRLVEGMGALPRRPLAKEIAALSPAERKALAACGVRIGAVSLFLPGMTGSRAVALRAALWAASADREPPPTPPRGGCWATEEGVPDSYYEQCGYRVIAGLAVRVDRLEKLAGEARRLAGQGPFTATAALAAAAGCAAEELSPLLAYLGYRAVPDESGVTFVTRSTRRRATRRKPARAAAAKPAKGGTAGDGRRRRTRKSRDYDPDSPFAKLRELGLN